MEPNTPNVEHQTALHCVTCWQPLPKGQEPEYFAGVSIGHTADTEAARAAEDMNQCARYLQTVSSAICGMLLLADHEKKLGLGEDYYLEHASSLCTLLSDLAYEAKRRVEALEKLVSERVRTCEKEA